MRNRVVERDVAVPAFTNHLLADDKHCTHRHFALGITRMRRQLKRTPHPALVIGREIDCQHRLHAYSHSIVAGGLPLMS